MSTGTMHDLMLDALRSAQDSEDQLLHALPRMTESAHQPPLVCALERWRAQTQLQVERLDLILDALGASDVRLSCERTAALLQRSAEPLTSHQAQDTIIALSAQEIAHHAVASYYRLLALARRIGQQEVATVLERSLSEDRDAWKQMTFLANDHAAAVALL